MATENHAPTTETEFIKVPTELSPLAEHAGGVWHADTARWEVPVGTKAETLKTTVRTYYDDIDAALAGDQ